MFSWKVPADGVTWTVRVNFCGGPICGGLLKLSVTVTGFLGSKPLARTTQAASAGPRLCCTIHAPGPPPAWPGEPHTVVGGEGGPGGLCELDPLSAEPRTTPTTTRAAPTAAQPAQARCARSQRRQPEPPAVPRPEPGRPGPVRLWPGLRRGAGL